MLGFLIFICLFVGVLGGLWHLAAFTERRTQDDTVLALDRVTKELASWDRVKELGFDDVLEWERAFEKATGVLPEGSRVKELEAKRSAALGKYRIGAPIYVSDSGFGYYIDGRGQAKREAWPHAF